MGPYWRQGTTLSHPSFEILFDHPLVATTLLCAASALFGLSLPFISLICFQVSSPFPHFELIEVRGYALFGSEFHIQHRVVELNLVEARRSEDQNLEANSILIRETC